MTNQDSASYAALMLRVSLGIMFIAHTLLKIMVFTPAGTVSFFASRQTRLYRPDHRARAVG